MKSHAMNDVDNVQMPPPALLRLLADGELHSGQELAQALGVSRTAIWKQLAKLESLGLELCSQAGKGYQLNGGLDLLDLGLLQASFSPQAKALCSSINLFDLVDSTNAWLLRQPPASGIHVCLAECQTAGRGRRARQWVSPFARNLYLSLSMSIESGVGALEGLSLAVGVVVADCLRAMGADEVTLKWPNDILWCGRKLGGVLLEVVGDPSGSCRLVLGLGLNLSGDKAMADKIDQPWVTLAEISPEPIGRNQVAASLIEALLGLLAGFQSTGFAPYRARWETYNAFADCAVQLRMGGEVVDGIMSGITESGALLLNTAEGERVFHGGEVSLRKLQ
jgi:BirA family transcriptional regulator, biotin operon repressor / biotin---[acetyl-CoA-carboxylase] ligase